MDDWFTEIVRRVSDEVVISPETAAKLELTDRRTREDLIAAAVSSEDELRTQFAHRVRAIQQVQDNIQQAEHEALSREWQAVLAARDRLTSYAPAAAPGWITRLWRKLHISPDAGPPGPSRAALKKAVLGAEQAYGDAKAAKKVEEREPVRTLSADVSRQQKALEGLLATALMLKVNEEIDGVLEKSYELVFSYAGRAILTDPLRASDQPVDTAAHHEIKYLIDEVGSGTIGVAGPRGSGKSTLLKLFAATTRIDDGPPSRWGVYVPAPAKYDPRDFLLYLFAKLCREVLGAEETRAVEDRLTSTRPSPNALSMAGQVLGILAVVLAACCGVVIGLRTAALGESPHGLTDLTIASCSVIALLVTSAALSRFSGVRRPGWRILRNEGVVRSWLWLAFVLSALGIAALFILVRVHDAPDPGYLAAGGLVAASMIALLALIYRPWWLASVPVGLGHLRYDDTDSDPEYVAAAREWYARVKFQQSFTTGWSGTVTVGTSALPVQAQGGGSASTAVTPLAMSIPEIVEAINTFTKILAAARSGPQYADETVTPVVIAIDEIDKIEDPGDAQAFLNQIKGLFLDESSLFLVSISDDAMAAFERRGTPFRDAFDSSLSSVVTLSYLSRAQARKLIGSRLVGVQEPVADLLYVLSGGLARDLVRLIRRADEARKPGTTTLDDLVVALVTSEVAVKKKAVLARARILEPCAANERLVAWAAERMIQTPKARTHGVPDYLTQLLTDATSLLDLACDGSAHRHRHRNRSAGSGDCVAGEIGAFGFWLATVGQLFSACSSRANFFAGESALGPKSFERLAEARQDFSLGSDYVRVATAAVRTAWRLPDLHEAADHAAEGRLELLQ